MRGLVPGALAAWAAVLAALAALAAGVPAADASRAALALAVAAAIGAALALAGRRWTAAGSLLIVMSAALSTAAYAQSIGAEPLAAVGSRVSAEVVVVGDVRVRAGDPPTLEVRCHLQRLAQRGEDVDLGAPVLLRLPAGEPPPIGALLSVDGTLGAGEPLRGYAATLSSDGFEVISPPGPFGSMANAVRDSLSASLAGAPPRAAALVEGLAVGDETAQPPELAEQMRIAGLSHLTAVSGGNTAIVVGAVLVVAMAVGLGLVARVILAGAALGAFVVVVGPQPSVLRAAVMAAVALVAILAGRPRTGVHALAFAVVVLLVLSPPLAASWGFALSVAATGGLIALAPGLLARLGGGSRLRRALVAALALTLAAQIATLPLIAAFGDGLSLVAVPANLLVVPAVAPVTVLGLLAAVAGTAIPQAGVVLARCAEPFAAWIALVAEWTSAWPGATLPWPGGPAGALLAAIVAAVAIHAIRRHRGRHERWGRPRSLALLAVAVAIVAILALRLPDRAGWPPAGWIAVACDVGQGDALILRGPEGGTVLVDAGPDPQAVDRCLDDLAVDRLDLLVLTHHHADHVDGVPGVLDGREVRAAMISPLREPIEQAEQVDAWLSGIPVSVAQPEQRWASGGIELTVLWPQRIIRGPESAPNNASVVLLAQVQGRRLLLLGDVEIAAQVALRTSLAAPGVDVVKIAHHGSRFQDPALASWTAGRIAIVSVGEGNRYGHPAPETIGAWQQSGAVIARTDRAGDVAVVVTGSALGVATRRAAAP